MHSIEKQKLNDVFDSIKCNYATNLFTKQTH